MTVMKFLYLGHNRITSIERGTFEGFDHLRVLDLSNNRLRKLCGKFNRTNIKSLFVNCIFQCPSSCLCYATSAKLTVFMDCSNKQLTTIPILDNKPLSVRSRIVLRLDGNDFYKLNESNFNDFTKVTKLYLNNSNIYEIDQMAFVNLKELKILNLTDNHLKAFPTGLFDGLGKLQHLYLSNNNLTVLSNDTLIHLKSLQKLHLHGNKLYKFMEWDLKNMPQLKELTLHQNDWSCDCSFGVELRDYLLYSQSVANASLVVCSYMSQTMSTLDFDDSYCIENSVVIWASIVAVCVALLLSVTLVFVYRHEVQVIIYSRTRLRMFNRSNVDETEGKLFDAFIAYNSDDVEFMFYNILPRLEEIDNPYRVCIHERDFLAGNVIADNIWHWYGTWHGTTSGRSCTMPCLNKGFLDCLCNHHLTL